MWGGRSSPGRASTENAPGGSETSHPGYEKGRLFRDRNGKNEETGCDWGGNEHGAEPSGGEEKRGRSGVV